MAPSHGPRRELRENLVKLPTLLRKRVFDPRRRVWVHLSLHDPLSLEFAEPFGQAGRAYALRPPLQFVEPRGLFQAEVMDHGQRPYLGKLVPRAMDNLAFVQHLLRYLLRLAQLNSTYLVSICYQV